MQTFLPYSNFKQTAECLDRARLGKQRVECLQILNAILFGKSGWLNHPAIKMWHGYQFALYSYGQSVCREWVARGYKDTCAQKMFNALVESGNAKGPFVMPPWVGDQKFHDSHKSNLLRKDFKFYSQYNWNISDNLPYYWPV
jgi:hypothetical protein